MVWFTKEDAEKYPHFAYLALKVMPVFANMPHIRTALSSSAGIDEAGSATRMKDVGGKALINLATGAFAPPQIAVWLVFGEFNRTAEYRPAEPDRIYVNINWIAKFERDHAKSEAQRFMLATVLHELVHYLDFKHDGRFLDAEIVGGKMKIDQENERGHLFEKLAFGGTVKPW